VDDLGRSNGLADLELEVDYARDCGTRRRFWEEEREMKDCEEKGRQIEIQGEGTR
jgi:hypothetical protein